LSERFGRSQPMRSGRWRLLLIVSDRAFVRPGSGFAFSTMLSSLLVFVHLLGAIVLTMPDGGALRQRLAPYAGKFPEGCGVARCARSCDRS
jgi:hypothetical protein